MVDHRAREAARTPSKLKLLFSCWRLFLALATLTNEMPIRACRFVMLLPQLRKTEFGDTCCPGTVMTCDWVNGRSNTMSKNRVYRSAEPQKAPLAAEPETSVLLTT